MVVLFAKEKGIGLVFSFECIGLIVSPVGTGLGPSLEGTGLGLRNSLSAKYSPSINWLMIWRVKYLV